MKILIIHCYYLQGGGEDNVFKQEHDLLYKHNDVRTITFKNKSGIAGAIQFFLSIWNIFAIRRLKKEIFEFKPDVVHLHNWHFGCGPVVIRAVANANIPIVLTLHNYRLICPSATLLNKDELFLDSVNAPFPWQAVKNGVYRNSKAQTFWLAFIVWFHKKIGTWNMVGKYIVLTEFAKEIMTQSTFGVNSERFIVKPNFVKAGPALTQVQRGEHFLFVGRLSAEKGINVLINAFQQSNYELQIAGDGPLREDIINVCKKSKNIKYKGALTKDRVLEAMLECSALIFPSIWYEGMPMTILESFASGTPVIASRLGSMKSMINDRMNGLLFDTGSPQSLLTQVEYWYLLKPEEKEKYRENCISFYHKNFTPEKSIVSLNNIYKKLTSEQTVNK